MFEVEPIDLLFLEVAQCERTPFEGEAVCPRTEVGIPADKADGLLFADDDAQGTIFSRDPIDKLQSVVAIPPLSG